MAHSYRDYLPSYEELKAPEIPLTAGPLRGGAVHFGLYCDFECKEFMLCKREEQDPRKCVKENVGVANCAFEFWSKMKAVCPQEYTDYWKCIDYNNSYLEFFPCKKVERVFDACMKDKMGLERPKLGYFTQVRVHESKRPRPNVYDIPMPDDSEVPKDMPDFSKYPPQEPKRRGVTNRGPISS